MKKIYLILFSVLIAGPSYGTDCDNIECSSGETVVGLMANESVTTCTCQAEAEQMTEQSPEVPDMADFGGE